jgi:hypothetical protein
MATAMSPTTQRPPTNRQRRHARELARLNRAATLYQRREQPAANDDSAWYAAYLRYHYSPEGWN